MGGIEVTTLERALRLAHGGRVQVHGDRGAVRPVLGDAGRMATPSRLARLVGSGAETPVTVRWVALSDPENSPPGLAGVVLALAHPGVCVRAVPACLLGVASVNGWDQPGAYVSLAAVALAVVGAKLLNDLRDHADSPAAGPAPGGARAVQRGWVTVPSAGRLALGMVVLAILIGAHLAFRRPVLLPLLAAGAVLAAPVVSSRVKLRRGWQGLLLVAVELGPLTAAGGALASVGVAGAATWLAGLSWGAAAALTRHLDDLRRTPDDVSRGFRSAAALLGLDRSLVLASGLAALVAVPPVLAVVSGVLPSRGLMGALAAVPLLVALVPARGARTPYDPGLARAAARLPVALWAAAALLLVGFRAG